MKRVSRNFFLALGCSIPSASHAQAAEPERISMAAFLVMCGFILLVVLIICSVIAQALLGFGIVSPGGRFGRVAMRLAGVVSDVRIEDGPRNSERKGGTGTKL